MGESTYEPSLRARAVGALQWAVTAWLLSLPAVMLFIEWPGVTDETLGDAGLLSVGAAGAAGLLRVQFRTHGPAAEAAAHRQRVEYLFDLVVWVVLTWVATVAALVAGFAQAYGFVVMTAGGVVAASVVAYVFEVEVYHPLARSLSGVVRRVRQFARLPS